MRRASDAGNAMCRHLAQLGLLPLPILLATCGAPAGQRASTDSTPRDLSLAPAGAPAAAVPLARRDVSPCLGFDDTVVIRGRLRREVYPGRPNYESIAEGDEAEPGFYLRLASPLCFRVAQPRGTVDDENSRDSVTHVQLVLDSAGYARLRPSLGRTIALRGTTFASFTGHHHAPVLLVPVGARQWMSGFPPAHCRVVATAVEGNDAVVVLDTGSAGQPYLYAVAAWRDADGWHEGSSGNALGWTITDYEHDLGTLAEWDYAPPGADAERVAFRGEVREVPVVDGAYLTAWWRLPCPEDDWPRLVAVRRAGTWIPVPFGPHGWPVVPDA